MIPTYVDKKAINSLPCYPFEAHENHKTLSATLIERGRAFRELCTKSKGHQMFNYKGEVTFTQAQEDEPSFMGIRFGSLPARNPFDGIDAVSN